MTDLGNTILPVLMGFILVYAMVQRVAVFDCFLSGAGEGIKTMVKLLPTLVGLITAVSMFKASGALDLLTGLLTPVAEWLGLPGEVVPLVLIHPISGGGATAVLTDLFSRYGAESTIGQIASVICGSGETTFYAITVYYGSVGVNQHRHTLPVALCADFTAAVLSGVGVRLFL